MPDRRHADADWASVLFYADRLYVIVALGLNIVVGLGRPARPRLRRLLRDRRVHRWPCSARATPTCRGFWAALPIAIAVAMLAGLILGAPTLRLRGDYLAIVTLGFGEIIRLTAQNIDWLGRPARHQPTSPRPPSIGPLHFGVLDPNAVLLPRPDVVIVIYLRPAPAREQPGRPGVDGDP